MKNTSIETALVSTNSICQGEQTTILWKDILNNGININFAYRTFRWDSEASIKAHVHCIIVGFSNCGRDIKYIFNENTIKKVNNDKEDYIMHIINNIGNELTANDVDILISDFLSYDIIDTKTAKLLKVATNDKVLQLDKSLKDKVRARIFKNMLLNI